ncbi:ureide permease 2 [Rosa chinensis]|uniref:ureide permease 2 n=1 Tax=Rosa chinensis TaxID=74649 RepID=UPI000D09259D|nr:ureide permease 2 [Rosa chinensis]XP_040374338.1 ureide permease 2 [Rosa chinensis]XP_040374339.1 ureide permease 2 [Rosa chinensis]
MYVVDSKGGAIACMLLALFLLGTWPAVLTMLERRGRLPQHTYLDYSITNLLVAVLIALTFGQIGSSTPDKPNFITQLSQDNLPSVLFAMAGGIVLSLGNLSSQYAFALVGLSLTEVITASITTVIGTTLNYFLDNRINKAEILFPGVACFLIAVCLGSAVHSSNAADNKVKLDSFPSDSKDGEKALKQIPDKDGLKDLESGNEKAKAGTADYLVQIENQRAIKVFGKKTYIGLAITFFAGLCFSLFTPAFNVATNDQWHTLKTGVPHLVVYTAFFYFSVSCFVIAIILNTIFLYRPILDLPKSSFKAYLNDWEGRGWALLAGLICGFGNGLQFMGGQAAGYAAADSVQALPLVSTFWGILLFGEYRKSSRRTYILLTGMLTMFIVAVAVLMASSGHRK